MKEKISRNTSKYLYDYREIFDVMKNEMSNAEVTESISKNFISTMIPHHAAAIKMSENLLKYTTYIPLQNMALQIIETQAKGIEEMQQIAEKCSALINTPMQLRAYKNSYNTAVNTMYAAMSTAPQFNSINCDFIREMIPHHRGAVFMSQNALRFPVCAELVPILKSIIAEQTRGIAEMKKMYTKLNPAY